MFGAITERAPLRPHTSISVSFSPDVSIVYRIIKIYDATTGTHVMNLEGCYGPVKNVILSQDRRFLASAFRGKKVCVVPSGIPWNIV
jgi:hypothetical protein